MLATELRSGRRLVACLVATAVLGAGAGSALAVDITVAYTPNFLAGPGAGGPPVGSVGVVEQAAHNWEAAILDPFAVTITFDWGVPDMGSQVCGVAKPTAENANHTRPTAGEVLLNSTLGNWFVDGSPHDHKEFVSVPGKAWMGTPTPATVGKEDMLSCAMHEIGHVLGYYYDGAGAMFGPYKTEVDAFVGTPPAKRDGIDVSAYIAGAGVVPVGDGSDDLRSHWLGGQALGGGASTDDLLMAKCLFCPPGGGGGRTLASAYDIAGLARIYGLAVGGGGYDLTPGAFLPVPEPAAIVPLSLAALTLLRRRR